MTESKETEPTRAARTRQEDAAIVERLREGDQGAFLDLFRQWHSTMVRVALNYVRRRGVAEEVAQETWLHFMQQLSRFNGRSSLRTWTFRILVNRAITRGKREHRAAAFLREAGSSGGPVGSSAALPTRSAGSPDVSAWAKGGAGSRTPEQVLLTTEARAQLEEAIRQLPDKQRLVLSLRDIQGWRSVEVCELLDITLENQRVLLHRARVKVRQALSSYLSRR